MVMKYVEQIAYVLALLSVLGYFEYPNIAPYMLALGAAGLCTCRWKEQYEGKNLRLRRINRIRHMIGIFWLVASYFMFKPGNYWLIAICVAIVLEIYTLLVHTYEMKKEQKVNQQANKK